MAQAGFNQYATISPEQIATLAQEAGFSSTRRHRGVREDAMAVAIALAESGGNTGAHNDTPPDDSYGLWQINMYGGLREERAKQFGLRAIAELYAPRKNAEAAYQIFRDAGNSFRPWSVYQSGAYLRHLSKANRAVQNPEDVKTVGETIKEKGKEIPIVGEAIDTYDYAKATYDVLAFIADSKNWIRVAGFVGGGMLVIFGFVVVANEMGIAKKVTDAIPAGKLVKKAL